MNAENRRLPPTNPREIVQMLDRITEVIASEYSHLSPADVVLGLNILIHQHCKAFQQIVEKHL
jgi:hypothetical protein